MPEKYEKLKIHFFYCILFLGVAIVLIATDRWTAQKDFTAYLSNAATMTSLVLGLVAIFYSFISNDSLSKGLGSISTVSDEVAQSRDKIAEFVSYTKSSTEAAGKTAEVIDRVTQEVASSLSGLQATLESIKTQSNTLHANVLGLPLRLDQLETKVIDATKSLGQSKEVSAKEDVRGGQKSVPIADDVAAKFLARSAPVFNLLTYALALAQQHNKKLVIRDFGAAANYPIPHSINGFISCMGAIGLVWYSYVDDYTNYGSISLNPYLRANTKAYIEDYARQTNDLDEIEKAKLLTSMRELEKLFA